MKQSIERVYTVLKERGHRLTQARKSVVTLLASKREPLTIQEIAHIAPVAHEASIYRTIALLRDEGLLLQVTDPRGVVKYELTTSHHHHIVCTACGYTAHTPCTLRTLKASAHSDFAHITDHEVTEYGVCRACV